MIRTILAIVGLALMLGACASHRGPGSIAGGECRIFEAPKYAIEGKTQYDQDWVDSTIEGGVGGCHWKRPAGRPASLDAPRTTTTAQVKAKQAKRPWFFKWKVKERAKVPVSKIWPDKPVTPVEAAPSLPEPTPATPVVTPPQPAPRSRIERLLHPNE